MQLTAILWHLRTLSDQPVVVSGVGLARFLPILLLSPLGGVAADTFNRRKIIFITQTAMTLSAAVLGLLTLTGVIQIWHIYILTAVQAVAMSFDLPARQSLVPNLVSKEAMASAFSLQSLAFNTGAVVGPALSGFVIGTLGQEYTYLINAASFLALLLALVLIGPVEQGTRPVVKGVRATLLSIGEGVQFILHQPIILSSMLLDFIATFFSSANTLLPFVARDLLKVGGIEYGWLASAEAFGAVMVGLFMSQRTHIRRQGLLLLSGVVTYGLATIWFGLAGSLLVAMLALTLVGVGDAVSTILRNTIRQLQTPDYIRGRMTSINLIFFQGGPQLGEIEAGIAAQAFGIPFAIISGGVGCILGVILVALRWPQLRHYRGNEHMLSPLSAGK
jgi:MFS family permease